MDRRVIKANKIDLYQECIDRKYGTEGEFPNSHIGWKGQYQMAIADEAFKPYMELADDLISAKYGRSSPRDYPHEVRRVCEEHDAYIPSGLDVKGLIGVVNHASSVGKGQVEKEVLALAFTLHKMNIFKRPTTAQLPS